MKKAMKIMAMVLFVVGMTALTSCSKSNEERILGKWELESISLNVNGMTMQMTPTQLAQLMGISLEEELGKIILEFKSDGYLYYQDEKVEYTVDDDQLTIKMDDGEPLVATITELTNKELVFEAEDFNSESDIASSIALYFKRA
jgi:hypothetical protein